MQFCAFGSSRLKKRPKLQTPSNNHRMTNSCLCWKAGKLTTPNPPTINSPHMARDVIMWRHSAVTDQGLFVRNLCSCEIVEGIDWRRIFPRVFGSRKWDFARELAFCLFCAAFIIHGTLSNDSPRLRKRVGRARANWFRHEFLWIIYSRCFRVALFFLAFACR